MAIVTHITKLRRYFRKNEKLEPIFKYFDAIYDQESEIKKRLLTLPQGAFDKVALDNGIFALEQKYMSKDRRSCFLESHRRFVDFQLILKGTELMEYGFIEDFKVERNYSNEKDLQTYVFEPTSLNTAILKPDYIGVYFPEDVHLGCQKYQASEEIVKTCLKVPIEILSTT